MIHEKKSNNLALIKNFKWWDTVKKKKKSSIKRLLYQEYSKPATLSFRSEGMIQNLHVQVKVEELYDL